MVTIYKSVGILFRIIETLIFIRIILSWINLRPHNSVIARFVYEMTEPILYPARELLDKIGLGGGMLDFSPVIAILIMNIILDILGRILF